MAEQYTNLANSTTVGSIDGVTNPITFSVQGGDGALFPTTANGNFRVIICDTNGANAEVMMVTSRATDTFTASRGAGASLELPVPTLVAHAGGSIVSHSITVGAMDGIRSNINQTGTVAAMPTVSKVGDEYWPSDGGMLYRSNGSAGTAGFIGWGPVYPLVRPVAANFTNFNFNALGATTTLNTAGDVLTITQVNGTGSGNIAAISQAIIGSTYTVDMAIAGCVNQVSDEQFGAFITDGTKAITMGLQWFTTSKAAFLTIAKYTNGTTFSASYQDGQTPILYSPLLFFRIQETASNRKYFISSDYRNWIPVRTSDSNTDFLTTTRYGVFVRQDTVAGAAMVTLYSLKATTP